MTPGRRPPAELARAYLKYTRTQADRDLWAAEEVSKRVLYAGAQAADAWEVALALVALADETNLDLVAAGPLEDVVTHFAPDLIDQIELQARRDPKFRQALGMIWLSHGDLPPALLERVVRASNGQIRPLGARDS